MSLIFFFALTKRCSGEEDVVVVVVVAGDGITGGGWAGLVAAEAEAGAELLWRSSSCRRFSSNAPLRNIASDIAFVHGRREITNRDCDLQENQENEEH